MVYQGLVQVAFLPPRHMIARKHKKGKVWGISEGGDLRG